MSKRHTNSRRRSYGRRLHEIHERQERRPGRDRPDGEWSSSLDDIQMDPLAFVDPRSPRSRFGFAD